MIRFFVPLILLSGCYTPPDLPTNPWEAELLVEDGLVEACAPPELVQAACVVDGDTFDAGICGQDGEGRIRLLGIDTPESANSESGAECYAAQAQSELRRLIEGQAVELTFDQECTGVFGRTLAWVWLPTSFAEQIIPSPLMEELERPFSASASRPGYILVNEYMILGGFATRFEAEWVGTLQWDPEMINAERVAQLRKEGLWTACQ